MQITRLTILTLSLACCSWTTSLSAQTETLVEAVNGSELFAFEHIPLPAIDDTGAKATWTVASGKLDRNSGALRVLNDGNLPASEDSPRENLFFEAGSRGGSLLADLGEPLEVKQIATYSCHPGARAPQQYKLYAAAGEPGGITLSADNPQQQEITGWKLLAEIDTRSRGVGGQHAVVIGDGQAQLGNKIRYLRIDVEPNDPADRFSQTFFSEIDILTSADTEPKRLTRPERQVIDFGTADGQYQFTIDVTRAPDLADWSKSELKPVIETWYPKIVDMLPSENFEAASKVTFSFESDEKMRGTPAWALGATISMNADWFRHELQREARGAVVHEMVHVVQAYQVTSQNRRRVPGWLVEGIPDYVRWFLYEPESQGANLTKPDLLKAKHDASYRVSGNFLDWAIRSYDTQGDLLKKLNSSLREGTYSSEIWMQLTGKTESDLADQWRKQ